MDASLRAALIALDEPGRLEFPANRASSFSWSFVDSALLDLSRITGRQLDVDRNVQDASFLTDIGLLDERGWNRITGTGTIAYEFAFRLSNFGHLFSVHGTRLSQWKDVCDLGVQLLSARGGRYVPCDALQQAYDGPNADVLVNETWWTRFFEYV